MQKKFLLKDVSRKELRAKTLQIIAERRRNVRKGIDYSSVS